MNNEYFPGTVTSIIIDENAQSPIVTSGETRFLKGVQRGIPLYQLFVNPEIDNREGLLNGITRNAVHNVLNTENTILGGTIAINKRVLDDSDLLAEIRRMAESCDSELTIRITDENYVLTREDLDKLSFATNIAVDYCEDELMNDNRIFLQNGVFKYEYQRDIQPVVERRISFYDLESRNALHVNHRLTDEEFDFLAETVELFPNASIELDYYDPTYYDEFLRKLQQRVSRQDIHIQLLGYLLEDQIEPFSNLEKYPYEIDVTYSTCHDMIDFYQKEPYTANRLYRSSIEGGGTTSIGNYLNVMEEMISFERIVRSTDMSPLEAAVYAKMRIDRTYIYDPDQVDVTVTDNPEDLFTIPDELQTDAWDNINLSQMLHHEVDGTKRAVCLGFATLYSAYLRRAGIPMFRCSTTSHCRNLGRIKDDKYGVDTLCLSDITWDLPDQNAGINSYAHFMIAPRDFMRYIVNDSGRHELLTIADTLALPEEEFDIFIPYTNDPYERHYQPFYYDPRGYAARLLELTGYASEEEELDFYDTVYRLNEERHLESIPEETVERAITNVFNKLSEYTPSITEETIREYMIDVLASFSVKDGYYSDEPALSGIDIYNPEEVATYTVRVLTPENVRDYRRALPERREERLIYPAHIAHRDEITPQENQEDNVEDISRSVEEKIEDVNPTRERQVIRDIVNHEDPVLEENNAEDLLDQSDELIPGTNIYKPRERGIYETDEEYVAFLKDYYERHFPNSSYVNSVFDFTKNNNITLYDYYISVLNNYRNHTENNLPEFERNNPFISEEDLHILLESNDNKIPIFFASSMQQTIQKNLSQYRIENNTNLFVDPVEKYNEEVGRINV